MAEHVARVADDAESRWRRVQNGGPALPEITRFLVNVVEASATNHAVKAASETLGADHGDGAAEARAGRALEALIRAGQRAGEIHPDVTAADVYLLMSAAPTDQPAPARARWLALILPGLTNQTRVPLL